MKPTKLLAASVLAAAAVSAQAAEPLPKHAADTAFSVSGLSAGAFMSNQLGVAYSSRVKAFGSLAGGPYNCAEGNVFQAVTTCMAPTTYGVPAPDPDRLLETAREFAAQGKIDPLSNLAGKPVYIQSGAYDATVETAVQDAENALLSQLGASVTYSRNELPMGHGIATLNYGVDCGSTASPFLNNCGFDGAGRVLTSLGLVRNPPATAQRGTLVKFDQNEFAGGNAASIHMDDVGFAYIPPECGAGGCETHVVIHGCSQGREVLGDEFARHTGYNRWADTNGLIMVYPQFVSSPINPNGCADWFGYTGTNYAQKSAPQMRAIVGMVDRLAGEDRGAFSDGFPGKPPFVGRHPGNGEHRPF